MGKRLEGELDEFEAALGAAALAPPEVHRIISMGIARGKSPQQVNRELEEYRQNHKFPEQAQYSH